MKTLHIIPHTHWDREWYMSFEQHRMKLVELIDSLIHTMENNPDFEFFHMDGQCIVIMDYLEIRPQMKERLFNLIRQDKIQIGPWYVLQDEFLISGEANIRNLLYGLSYCKKIGAHPVMCGYFPDAFGNISQAPQILKGFGIEYAVFGRGINSLGTNNSIVSQAGISDSELIWQAPDGSEVVSVMFANWYHNAMELPQEKLLLQEKFNRIIENASKYAKTPHLLGMNGCDHQPVQVNLPEIIKLSKEMRNDVEVKFSNFKDYLSAITEFKDNFKPFQGEITGQLTDGMFTLVNTASSRIPLKQFNHKAQVLIERICEPINSIAFICGFDYPMDFIYYSWTKLLENHPHDSICGCHTDEVFDDMMSRFGKSIQVSNTLTDNALKYLCNNINTENGQDKNIIVWNLEPFGAFIKASVFVDFDLNDSIEDFHIINSKSEFVPAKIKHVGKTFTYELPSSTFRKHKFVNRFSVDFCLEMKSGFSYEMLQIVPKKSTVISKILMTDTTAENEYFCLSINNNGSLRIVDKLSSTIFDNLNLFEDSGDKGDLYVFRPTEDLNTEARFLKSSVFEASPCSATFLIEYVIDIPFNYKDRCATKFSTYQIASYVTITLGIARVDIKTVFNNSCDNHRLRAIFNNDIITNKSFAEGQFDIVERDIEPWEGWTNPSNCLRAQAFFGLCDTKKGLLIATKGLPEFEVERDGSNKLSLTLLRSVGEIGDWGVFPTDKGQCKGLHSFEYSIIPFLPADKSKAFRLAYNFSNSAGLAICTDKHKGLLPCNNSFFDIQGDFVNISSLKKSEERDSVIIRLHNLSDENNIIDVRCNNVFKNAYIVNLNEERQEKLDIVNGLITIQMRKKQILSIEFLSNFKMPFSE